ncbi:Ig-like domain-containing protein, partial [Vibrio lentus]
MDMTTLNLGGALALGQRIVISVDGTIKVLEEGQPLQAGDVVLESQNGSNEPQLSAKRFSPEEGGEVELDQDIANIFAALEEGQDPTELGEEFATAAGQNGSSLSASGTIERDGEETIPGTDFVTTGFEALGMSRTQSLSLLDAFRSLTESATPLNSNPSFVDSNNAETGDVVTFTTDEDTPVNGVLNALDEDSDTLTFSLSQSPNNGSVVLNNDGSWTYTPDNNFNGNDSFSVVVSDGQGGTDTITVNVGVTPVNDTPVITDENGNPLGDSVEVTTDEDTPVSGSLSASDDDNDSLSFSEGSDPSNGSVTVDENGNWTYTPNEDYNGSDSFTIIVSDGKGGTDTQTITITVTGTNDAPVAAADVETGATEGGDEISGTVTATDVDTAQGDLTYSVVDANGDAVSAPAGFTLTGNAWTFDPTNAAYDSLAVGETTDVEVTVLVDDGKGGTDTQTITITVTGTNDAPVAAADVETGATEGGDEISGTVTATDVDTAQGDLTYSVVDANGDAVSAPAGFTLTGNAWTFDPTNAAYDSLAVGETTDVEVTVLVDDGKGGTDTQTITITVTGTNDAPVAAADVETGATEGGDEISGTVTATDVDTAQGDLTYSVVDANGDAVSAPAGFTLTGNAWTFDPTNAAYDSLAVGETTDVEVTVLVDDGKGGTDTQTITITVTGTNDAPVAAADVETGATEGGDEISGTVTATDVDTAQGDLTYSVVDANGDAVSAPAGFTLTGNAWTFDPTNAAYDSLAVGETTDVEVTVLVDDGKGGTDTQTITITVTGTNDAPVAAADVETGATEGGDEISGTVTATDVDTAQGDLTYSVVDANGDAVSAPAGFTLTGNAWTFDPTNAAYDSLAVGETTDVEVTVLVDDGKGGTDTQTITITVTGTNDAPVAAADVETGATEGGDEISGTVTATDVDTAQGDLTYSVVDANGDAVSAPAGFTLTGNAWTFDPTNAAYDSLAVGETTDVEVTVLVDDGKGGTDTQTITITVTGTNDAPVAAADVETGATEGGDEISGTVTATDVDTAQGDLTYSVVDANGDAVSAPAGFTLTGNAWTFDPTNAAYDSLAVGETTDVEVTVLVDDGKGGTDTQTITITVTGTNDAPVAAADVETGATEGGDEISGTVTATDVDTAQGDLTYSVVDANGDAVSAPAGFTLTGNAWTFDPTNAAYDSLAVGETTDVEVTVLVDDGKGGTDTQTITITVTGTNDAPVAAADVETGATEGGDEISGTVTATDVDTAQGDLTYSVVDANGDAVSAPAGFTLTGNAWTFDPTNAAYDSLAVGETTDVEVTVLVDDGKGGTDTQTITITVTGTNDAPVAAADVETGATEGGDEISGTVTATDVDTAQGDLTYSVVDANGDAVSAPAGFTLTGNAWTFDPTNAAYDSLAVGETTDVEVTVLVDDGKGGTDTQTITITVTGTNDAPVAAADVETGATEGGDEISGTVTATDVDTAQGDLTYSVVDANGDAVSAPAGFTLTGNAWTFDPTNAAYDSLAVGETTDVEVTVLVDDGKGGTDTQTITITVTGTNDAPVAAADVETGATEGGDEISGTVTATDVDTAQGDLTYSVVDANGDAVSAPAGFTLTGNAWTFDPTNAAYDSLAVGETTDVEVTVLVDDGKGGTDTQTITITVTGTNDAPVAAADVETGATEGGDEISGTVTATDVDTAQGDLTYSVVDANGDAVSAPAGFTLTGNAWTFDPTNAAYDSLAVGETTDVEVTVLVDDGKGGTDTQTITITVTGTNDAPVAAADVETGATEGGDEISGTVTATDVDTAQGDLTYSVVDANGDAVSAPAGFTLTGNAWTFDPTNAAYDSLAVGETTDVEVTVLVDDGKGGTDTQTITITVTGTNDAPVAAADVETGATEGGDEISGTVTATDVDTAQGDLTYSVVDANGDAVSAPAGFTLTGNAWTFDPTNAAYDSLAVGETTDVEVTVLVDDGKGGTDTQTITITVTGTNDAPVAAADVETGATEGGDEISGTVTATDVDTAQGDLTYSVV